MNIDQRAKVAVVRCTSYQSDEVAQSLHILISFFEKNIFPFRKKVLLKPNLISSTKTPGVPSNTNPAILEALIEVLKNDYRCEVYIGDSSGGTSYGETRRALELTGINALAQKHGIVVANFETAALTTVINDHAQIQREFRITQYVKDVDCIISVAKLKSHSLVGFTGAVKNMMGVVPGCGKRDMHMTAPHADAMKSCIVDLYGVVKPHFAIIDGIIGMDGDGPTAGNPRDIGLLMGSDDAVALDAVAMRVTGYREDEMNMLHDAEARGYGVCAQERIHVCGEQIEKVFIPDFVKPVTGMRNIVLNAFPKFLIRALMAGMTSGKPAIAQARCRRCGICLENCPAHVIVRRESGKYLIKQKKCIECYCCHELCPHKAIDIKIAFFVRAMKKLFDLARVVVRLARRK